jgi:hypothetical protein
MPKCECLSIHSSLPLGPRHHAIPRNQRKQFLCRTEAKLPTASISAESFEEILLRWTRFFTKLGPQIRLPPVPIFGLTVLAYKFPRLFSYARNDSTSVEKIMEAEDLDSIFPPTSFSRSFWWNVAAAWSSEWCTCNHLGPFAPLVRVCFGDKWQPYACD